MFGLVPRINQAAAAGGCDAGREPEATGKEKKNKENYHGKKKWLPPTHWMLALNKEQRDKVVVALSGWGKGKTADNLAWQTFMESVVPECKPFEFTATQWASFKKGAMKSLANRIKASEAAMQKITNIHNLKTL